MSLGSWIFKKNVKKLAKKMIDGEDNIDKAVDEFLVRINWGMIAGFIGRKLIGVFK